MAWWYGAGNRNRELFAFSVDCVVSCRENGHARLSALLGVRRGGAAGYLRINGSDIDPKSHMFFIRATAFCLLRPVEADTPRVSEPSASIRLRHHDLKLERGGRRDTRSA